MQLILNHDFLKQEIKVIPPETSQELAEIQTITKKLEQKNTDLKKMIEETIASNKQDIAIRIREKNIEQTILNKLENEAFQNYDREKKTSFFRKLFYSTQINIEKDSYVAAYIGGHFSKQLTSALNEYHNQSLGYPDQQNASS